MRTANPTNVHDRIVNALYGLHDMRDDAHKIKTSNQAAVRVRKALKDLERECKAIRFMVQAERPGVKLKVA